MQVVAGFAESAFFRLLMAVEAIIRTFFTFSAYKSETCLAKGTRKVGSVLDLVILLATIKAVLDAAGLTSNTIH